MEISRSYTVVPSSLTNQTEDDVKEGRAFYLMIKIYADGALTQVLGKLAEGKCKVHTFRNYFCMKNVNLSHHDLVSTVIL